MMTKEESFKAGLTHLRKQCSTTLEIVILKEFTIEKPYGFVLFFNSKEFVETRNHKVSLLGAWPIVVLKKNGVVHDLQGGIKPELAIAQYEASMGASFS